MLDAVVVTGYQTVERRKLTAAVSKLDISDETIMFNILICVKCVKIG